MKLAREGNKEQEVETMGVFKRKFKCKDSKTSEYSYIDYLVDGKRRWESVGKVGIVSKSDAKKLLSIRKAESIKIGLGFNKPKKSPLFKEFAREYIKFAEDKCNELKGIKDVCAVLRGQCPRGRAGSTPAFGTIVLFYSDWREP